jgi:hypothetical protein
MSENLDMGHPANENGVPEGAPFSFAMGIVYGGEGKLHAKGESASQRVGGLRFVDSLPKCKRRV